MFSKNVFGIVSNLRFISRTKFMLRCVEHEKCFIASGPDCMDAQADLSLRWAHMSEGMFSHVEAQFLLLMVVYDGIC